jgi:transketolase
MFAESGDYEQLLEKYGLTADNIVEKAKDAMCKKASNLVVKYRGDGVEC